MKKLFKGLISKAGYKIQVSRIVKPLPTQLPPQQSYIDKIWFGNELEDKNGYVKVYFKKYPSVEFVTKPWKLKNLTASVGEIYCPSFTSLFRIEESITILNHWFEILKIGGHLKINLGKNSLTFFKLLLNNFGFSDINYTKISDDVFQIVGYKTLNKGERQVSPNLEDIRIDHISRYVFAEEFIRENVNLLDIACGIGYGSKILAENKGITSITAVDIDPGAIAYAVEHFNNDKIKFIEADGVKVQFDADSFDIALSFETIEHLENPSLLLNNIAKFLKKEGMFICSTPNEEVLPFNKEIFKYHTRHYRPTEFEKLLNDSGFTVIKKYTQKDSESDGISLGWDGKYNIAVCKLGKTIS